MEFVPFLTAPTTTDKDWIHFSKGGNNYCIEIQNGSVLPDCTGFVWGLWRKRLGYKHKLCINQAEKWYLNTQDGYKRGKTPKLGACICWKTGDPLNPNDGLGHVASVEKIFEDGSILVAESHWFSNPNKRIRYTTTKIPANYAYPGSSLQFQGFIYIPIDYDPKPKPVPPGPIKPIYKIGSLYKTKVILNVRKGPSTNADIKGYYELTTNARANAYPPSDPKNAGRLKVNTFVTCLETKNVGDDIWIRIPSGWICGYYKGQVFVG